MAFMFETCYMMKITDYAANSESQDTTYVKDSYSKMIRHFDMTKISGANGSQSEQIGDSKEESLQAVAGQNMPPHLKKRLEEREKQQAAKQVKT